MINKTDLVPPEQVARVQGAVRAVAPNVRMVTATFADVPIPLLDELRRPMVVSAGAPGEGRREPVFSHTLQAEGHFSRQGWEGFVGSLGPGLMRLKGFISLEGDAVYVDATTARMTLSSTGRPGDGQNRLVIIGQGLQHQVIEAAFSRELTGTAP
ncbi:MAG: GTP-binding protein [Candidatus Oleimicrobiaceae bacterium]